MKIIQLVYSLSSGGAEKFVVDLSNEMARRGHDVTLCMLLDDAPEGRAFNKQFLSPAVRFRSLHFERGFSLGKVRTVEKFILGEKPDIVHCHLNVIPYVFRLAMTRRKIRFFHTLHSVAEKASGASAQKRINRFFYARRWIRPVTISRLCQESFVRFYHLPPAPHIDNGRSTVAPSAALSAVRQEVDGYKATASTPVFIHVARCDALKNQRLLISTFNRLDKEGTDFCLLVLGAGYGSDEGKQLQQMACNKIHFLGEKSNVGDYLLCADAFCLSSRYEGLPISLLEALSCGLTPICTAVGGIPDVVSDGETGYLSAVSEEGYHQALLRFLHRRIDPEKLKAHFRANYSIAVCAEKYLALFQS